MIKTKLDQVMDDTTMKTDVLERMNINLNVWRARLCDFLPYALEKMADVWLDWRAWLDERLPTVEIKRKGCLAIIFRWPNPNWTIVRQTLLPGNDLRCLYVRRETPSLGTPEERNISYGVRIGDSRKHYFLHLEKVSEFFEDVEVLCEAINWLDDNPSQCNVPPLEDR